MTYYGFGAKPEVKDGERLADHLPVRSSGYKVDILRDCHCQWIAWYDGVWLTIEETGNV